jgi:hypothetical protein
VSGFGVVFSDVNLPGTSIAVATTEGGIGPLPVATFTGNLVTGTTALGPSESGTVDLVVMDDFLYGEPQQVPPQQVPEPASLLLLALGLLAVRGGSLGTALSLLRLINLWHRVGA